MEQQHYEQYDEISLKELIIALWDGKKWIIGFTLLAIALAAIYSFAIAKPVYEVTSELVIQKPVEEPTRYGVYTFPSENPADYINSIKSGDVIKQVIAQHQLDTTVASFQKNITIANDAKQEESRFLITTTGNSAETAARVNNDLVQTFITSQRVKYKGYAIDRFIINYERSIDNTQLAIESKMRLLVEREALLKEIQPIYTLQKSLFNDPETAAAYADKFDLDLSQLSQSMLVEENARDIYLKMEEKYIELKDELISLKESLYTSNIKYQELLKEREAVTANLAKGDYAEILNGEVDVFADKVLVVSPAFEPQKPVAPRKALNLAIGAVLGFMIGVFVAFFINYWKKATLNS